MTRYSTYLKRREKLAEFLDTKVERKYFDMQYVTQGVFPELSPVAAACVMGWAQVVFPKEHKTYGDDYMKFIEDTLGLTILERFRLTEATAKHQTPKADAKYIRKHLME